MISEIPHPRLGKVRVINTPVKLSRTPGRIGESAPDLGKDTGDILSEFLEMSEADVEKLRESEVV